MLAVGCEQPVEDARRSPAFPAVPQRFRLSLSSVSDSRSALYGGCGGRIVILEKNALVFFTALFSLSGVATSDNEKSAVEKPC